MAGTWERIEEWGQEHPVALGVGVFVVGAIILYALWPSSAAQPAAAAGPSDAYYNAIAAMAQSGNSLQAAQLQAQQAAGATQAQLTAVQTQVAGQTAVATINAQTTQAVAQIQADQADYNTRATQESADLASTLTAQTQQAGLATQQNIAGINATAATTQAQIAATTSTTNTATNAAAQEAGYLAQLQQVIAQTTGGVQIAGINANAQTTQALGLATINAQTADFSKILDTATQQINAGVPTSQGPLWLESIALPYTTVGAIPGTTAPGNFGPSGSPAVQVGPNQYAWAPPPAGWNVGGLSGPVPQGSSSGMTLAGTVPYNTGIAIPV